MQFLNHQLIYYTTQLNRRYPEICHISICTGYLFITFFPFPFTYYFLTLFLITYFLILSHFLPSLPTNFLPTLMLCHPYHDLIFYNLIHTTHSSFLQTLRQPYTSHPCAYVQTLISLV